MKSETEKSRPFYQHCAPFFAMIFAFGLSACSTSSDATDPNSPKAQELAQAQERIKASDLLGFCPPVTIREGTAIISNYGKAEKTPENLIYQASISNETRSCKTVDGTLTMNVAIAGKIVPGPKFAPGTVNMPIRVAVVQGSDVLYSKLHTQQISATPGAATQFVFNDAEVAFPKPTAQNVQVFIGFDEAGAAPAKKRKS
ncbi:hypothetical protein M8997_014765 [Phyllobacterium sp. 21LDTY02-6]|uniref:hypothetical protein n=1 Tax=unclassified Phyllobacterium TaxID=2638441 RepID=UPI0020209FB3|nr:MULTISPECIES: hypothetical protein [unclassified Phyllobacterium]MCO4318455.1 hypothetical protein [Phyllobacterium sp. 21LDTY02-6]MCX8281372.1 hypothetical protein [Phyllobacterium sp. 0TCS1.6C]MCX8295972.1 hypothetical protein [Phyllobacterium sp. 0TCS1.6A]